MTIDRVGGRKFLVTGGAGFLGSALSKGLLARGGHVRTLDNNVRHGIQAFTAAERMEIVNGDIRDPEIVKAAAEGVDCVCHLAYINGTEFFYTKPELVLEVAVKGMMNVIDACIAHRVPELILVSSSEVYQTPPCIPTDETAPLVVPDVMNPRFSYGGGKIVSELLAINYGRTHFDRVLIIRPHNIYGPNMGREHVIPQFILRMKESMDRQPAGPVRFAIQGTGEETRAFIYIDDFVQGALCVLDNGEPLGIYHVGSDRETSIRDLAHMVAQLWGRGIELAQGQLLEGSTLRRCPDVTKLKALGFAPCISLETGLRRTADWYLSNLASVSS